MRVLIVAATAPEIWRSLPAIPEHDVMAGNIFRVQQDKLSLSVLITGPGMVPTTYFMARALSADNYDLVINCGICGSFNKEIPIGEAVHVVSDCFADMGAVSDLGFVPLYSMKMAEPHKPLFAASDGTIENTPQLKLESVDNLRRVKGITVNSVSGNETEIDLLKARTGAQTESMEGAAFFYSCMMNGVACLQVRTVSNYVAPRGKAQWNTEAALKNLSFQITRILEELNKQA